MKRLILILLSFVLILFSSCSRDERTVSDGLVITAVNFPCYDAARAIAGDRADIRMLLPVGTESHSYEPSPEDIVRILSSDLFIYTGGESDYWVESLLKDLDGQVKTFSLIGHAPVVFYESEVDSLQNEEEEEEGVVFDEHVWTSLSNEIAIIKALCGTMSGLDMGNAPFFEDNCNAYVSKLEDLKVGFSSLFDEAGHPEMVVADRFPLIYFVSEFDLPYLAAFPGCANESEPGAKTVASIIDKVKAEKIGCIFHMELSNTMLAELVAEETGAGVYQFNSCHNVSKRQFDEGITYVDLMQENLETLRKAYL